MPNRLTVALRWLIAGTLAGGILGSVGTAVAQTDESTTTTAPPSSSATAPSPSAPADDAGKPRQRSDGKGCHHRRPGRPGRAEVTGEAADKAKAAALAAVPGATAHRVMAGRDGGYVVLLTKADGARAAVKLDSSFTVTSVEDKVGRRGGRGHRHGPPPAARGRAADGSAATPTDI